MPSTETFTGTAPNTANALTIQVTATDTGGLSTSETFSAVIPSCAPILTAQTASQTWAENAKVSFALPSNTFTDPQGQKLTYTATQSNGWSLPSWLSFNPIDGDLLRHDAEDGDVSQYHRHGHRREQTFGIRNIYCLRRRRTGMAHAIAAVQSRARRRDYQSDSPDARGTASLVRAKSVKRRPY